MSELAFNANGESFELPATVTGWRVRRMKPRGAPELVYGKDGRPLTINIDADIDELRDAVGSNGKYRLDPINDDGKCVENVPAAYVHVMKPIRNGDAGVVVAQASSAGDDTIREAMRMNTELARSVIDRFPEMMQAAAELLRAADGAGLPGRSPRATNSGDEAEDEPEPTQASPTTAFLTQVVGQVVPLLIAGFSGKAAPKLAEVVDWRKAAAASSNGKAEQNATNTVPENATAIIPPIDAETMTHFIAIQSALKPEEAALAREVAANFGAAELHAWFDELKKLTVPQAVQKIRVLIAGNTEAVS